MFKVGTKVVVKDEIHVWGGWPGTIVNILDTSVMPYDVDLSGYGIVNFDAEELQEYLCSDGE